MDSENALRDGFGDLIPVRMRSVVSWYRVDSVEGGRIYIEEGETALV